MENDGVKKIVSVKEVAEFLQITEETVYNLAKAGKIPAIKIGNQWRFDLDRLKKLFQQGSSPVENRKDGDSGDRTQT